MRILIGIMAVVFMIGSWIPVSAASSMSGTVSMEVDLSGHDKDKEVKLWIPYPISDKD